MSGLKKVLLKEKLLIKRLNGLFIAFLFLFARQIALVKLFLIIINVEMGISDLLGYITLRKVQVILFIKY